MRRWGVPATQEERLTVDTFTNGSNDEYTSTPLGSRKRPSPAEDALELRGARITWEGDDTDSPQEATTTPKRIRKHRKSTHAVRKEEKERLLKEMEKLNEQITSLKQRALASMGNADPETARSIQVKRELRADVQENQHKFGELASIITEFSLCNAQAGSPLHDCMLLKQDRESRRKMLRALKASKMPKAEHFLELRRPNTNLQKICEEGRRFEMDNGDFYSERLTVTQFKDARSVKQIYDLLLFYYCNLEISISEKIGHITIREDDDTGSKSITQNRLVSTTIRDIKVESNTITFAHFYERSEEKSNGHGEGDYGMIVMDYVDDDEKYPYQPDRIRKDVVAVMEVREWKPQLSNTADKVTVVLTRWVQNKLRRPKFPVDLKDWCDLRDRVDLYGKLMQLSLAEDLHIARVGLELASAGDD